MLGMIPIYYGDSDDTRPCLCRPTTAGAEDRLLLSGQRKLSFMEAHP